MVERIRVIIEKRLNFEPIRLKKKVSPDRIGALTDESWISSGILPLLSRSSTQSQLLLGGDCQYGTRGFKEECDHP
jgi:hypothetical protein